MTRKFVWGRAHSPVPPSAAKRGVGVGYDEQIETYGIRHCARSGAGSGCGSYGRARCYLAGNWNCDRHGAWRVVPALRKRVSRVRRTPSGAPGKQRPVMTKQKSLGVAIVLIVAGGAALGLVTGHLSIVVAIGIAVSGILIGTGVARGKFSDPSGPGKN